MKQPSFITIQRKEGKDCVIAALQIFFNENYDKLYLELLNKTRQFLYEIGYKRLPKSLNMTGVPDKILIPYMKQRGFEFNTEPTNINNLPENCLVFYVNKKIRGKVKGHLNCKKDGFIHEHPSLIEKTLDSDIKGYFKKEI